MQKLKIFFLSVYIIVHSEPSFAKEFDVVGDAINIEGNVEPEPVVVKPEPIAIEVDTGGNNPGGNVAFEGGGANSEVATSKKRSSSRSPSTTGNTRKQYLDSLKKEVVFGEVFFISPEAQEKFDKIKDLRSATNISNYATSIGAVLANSPSTTGGSLKSNIKNLFEKILLIATSDSSSNIDKVIESNSLLSQTTRIEILSIIRTELRDGQRMSRVDRIFWEHMLNLFSNPAHYKNGGIRRGPSGLEFNDLPAAAYKSNVEFTASNHDISIFIQFLRAWGKNPQSKDLLVQIEWLPDLDYGDRWSSITPAELPKNISLRDTLFINAALSTLSCQDQKNARHWWYRFALGNKASENMWRWVDNQISIKLTYQDAYNRANSYYTRNILIQSHLEPGETIPSYGTAYKTFRKSPPCN